MIPPAESGSRRASSRERSRRVEVPNGPNLLRCLAFVIEVQGVSGLSRRLFVVAAVAVR